MSFCPYFSTMASLFSKYKPIFFLLLLGIFTGFEVLNEEGGLYHYLDYELASSSTLEIYGRTNVNSFCCSAQQNFPKSTLGYEWSQDKTSIDFDNTELKISTRTLDCGASAINRDLQEVLKADEYPYIIITLKEAVNSKGNKILTLNKWETFEATTQITLCCVTNEVSIPVRIRKTSDKNFQIKGSTSLAFRDFDLEPPTAMMGLIKVKETLDVSFDLDAVLK